MDRQGALLESVTESLQDPVETFACSFRLTGLFLRGHPGEGRVLLNSGLVAILSDRGLAPLARRDIDAASRAGRFDVADPELAMAMAAGTLSGLGVLLREQPERDPVETIDLMTERLLRAFGLTPDEAHEISRRPLPDLGDPTEPNSAA